MSRIRRKTTERVGDYGIFSLHRHELVDAQGERLHDAFTFAMRDWVSIVPVTNDGTFVLVRQYRSGIDAPTLEVPGGIIDEGQTPADAALRELREESGYGGGRLARLGATRPNPALQDNWHHMFLLVGAEILGEPCFDGGEYCEVVLLTRKEIRRCIRNGDITHALVLLALTRAFDVLDRKPSPDWSP
ncbi:MAG TPA: NUDIX hydrolase [Polyangiaceae bacterium]|jgi:8-oxo-dGTP pyrophosphatase MutT (NUDIX family)|nr:NUDIX hydrolase [Polyangiaceae bacterium]